MPLPILHDKGISRVIGPSKIEKGKWYFGFICKHCSSHIYSLTDPSAGQTTGPVAIGSGKLSVPCTACGKDEIIYETSELVPLQAQADSGTTPALPRRKASGKARQKLSNRYPLAKATFGTRFIEDRPECAVIFSRCIVAWSYVEQQTALLLAVILKINTAPALAMFLAMQSTRTQIPVLTAAANVVLDGRDFELFQAIMNIRRTIEKSRNDLAHGLIGGSLNVSDGILWIDQRDMARHTATVWGTDFSKMQTPFLDAVYVYEAEDLETVAQNLEWLHDFMGSFRGYLGSDNAAWREGRYHQLCAEPRVRAEIDRLRNSQKKSPSTPQPQSGRDDEAQE